MNKQLTIDGRLKLLLESNWDYKQIAEYFGCGVTKASEIKRKARIHNGGEPKLLKNLVTVSAVFEIMGINLQDEISRIKAVKEVYDTDLAIGVA